MEIRKSAEDYLDMMLMLQEKHCIPSFPVSHYSFEFQIENRWSNLLEQPLDNKHT